MHAVVIPTSVKKQIKSLAADRRERVMLAIARLAADPRPAGCKKIAGSADEYRIRIGDYRVIYAVDDREKVVIIEKVAHRREVYR